MNRRDLLAGALATAVARPRVMQGAPSTTRDNITITAEGVRITYPPFGIKAEAITIAGVSIPQFSAGWVALNLAGGVLAQLGGALFGLLVAALGARGPTLEDLLTRQLEAIADILREELENNEIRRSIGRLASIRQKMIEYRQAPQSLDRLYDATADSQNVISDLQTLGFDTYLQVLSAGSVRLAILQERAKLDQAETGNYRNFVSSLVTYHETTRESVEYLTNPYVVVRPLFPEQWTALDPDTTSLPVKSASDQFISKLAAMAGNRILEGRLLNYRVRDLPKLSFSAPEGQLLVIDAYNRGPYDVWSMQRPPNVPPINPGQPPFPRDETRWMTMQGFVSKILTEPQDKIAARYIDWAKLRRQIRETAIIVGDKVVEDWKASVSRAPA
jgi:hypothetical protein